MSREEFVRNARRIARHHPRSREIDYWGLACRSTGLADLSYAMVYEDEKVMISAAIGSEALFVFMKRPFRRSVVLPDDRREVALHEEFDSLDEHFGRLSRECRRLQAA